MPLLQNAASPGFSASYKVVPFHKTARHQRVTADPTNDDLPDIARATTDVSTPLLMTSTFAIVGEFEESVFAGLCRSS